MSWLSLPAAARRPLGLFWVGPTGVGKTELARAISLALFESRERAEIIPFGEVSNEHRLNQVIGAPPGTIGSDEVRAFERALRNMPEGGVLVVRRNLQHGRERRHAGRPVQASLSSLRGRALDVVGDGRNLRSQQVCDRPDGQRRRGFFQGNRLGRDSRADLAETESAREGAPDARRTRRAAALPRAHGRRHPVQAAHPRHCSGRGREARRRHSRSLRRARNRDPRRRSVLPEFWRPVLHRRQGRAQSARHGDPSAQPCHRRRAVRKSAARRKRCAPTGCVCGSSRNSPTGRSSGRTIPKPRWSSSWRSARAEATFARIVVAKDYTQFAATPKRLPETQARAIAYHEAGHAVVNDPAVTGQKLTWLTIARRRRQSRVRAIRRRRGPARLCRRPPPGRAAARAADGGANGDDDGGLRAGRRLGRRPARGAPARAPHDPRMGPRSRISRRCAGSRYRSQR